jgi:hypothetical protein
MLRRPQSVQLSYLMAGFEPSILGLRDGTSTTVLQGPQTKFINHLELISTNTEYSNRKEISNQIFFYLCFKLSHIQKTSLFCLT